MFRNNMAMCRFSDRADGAIDPTPLRTGCQRVQALDIKPAFNVPFSGLSNDYLTERA